MSLSYDNQPQNHIAPAFIPASDQKFSDEKATLRRLLELQEEHKKNKRFAYCATILTLALLMLLGYVIGHAINTGTDFLIALFASFMSSGIITLICSFVFRPIIKEATLEKLYAQQISEKIK